MTDRMRLFSLADRRCVLLGSEGLLGSACANALRDSGARKVYRIDRATAGDSDGFFAADATDEAVLNAVFEKILSDDSADTKEWIFINASYPRTKLWGTYGFEDIPLEEWKQNVDLHLGSAFSFSRLAVQALRAKKKPGAVVHFGSIYGIVGPDLGIYEGTKMKNPATYAAIKSGISGLSRYIASVYGVNGIRSNVISPGGVEDNQPESFRKEYYKRTPLGRMATTEDVAGVVAFFSSPAASYITGQEIAVDGGWTAR